MMISYTTIFLLSFFPFFSILLYYLQAKANTKKKCHQGSNTSGSKNLKEALLIIINSQAYHHESPAKISARDKSGRLSKPASKLLIHHMHA
jgi:hypothetical protein